MDPGADLLGKWFAAGALPGLGGALAQEEGDNEPAADDAEEVAAVHLELGIQFVALGLEREIDEGLLAHFSPPFMAFAASSTAVTMR